MKKFICFLNFTALIFYLSGCSAKKTQSFDFFAMDTYCNVTIYDSENKNATDSAGDISEKVAQDVEHLLNSGISSKIIFAAEDAQEIQLKDDLADILRTSLYVSEVSDGDFDLTIAPLSSLWDINNKKQPPAYEEIEKAMALVGYKNLSLNGNILTFGKKGMGIDLGAVGKGFAADKMKSELKAAGYENGIINLGGNINIFGDKNGKGYNIGIKSPLSSSVLGYVNVKDSSVVTSGGYERYFEYNGKRYHHILDPQTGYPSESGLISVTIIAKNSLLADALSTAIYVSGLQDGEKIFNTISGLNEKSENPNTSLYDDAFGLQGAVIITEDKKIYIWGDISFILQSTEFSLSN